jgi:hypothetical protein
VDADNRGGARLATEHLRPAQDRDHHRPHRRGRRNRPPAGVSGCPRGRRPGQLAGRAGRLQRGRREPRDGSPARSCARPGRGLHRLRPDGHRRAPHSRGRRSHGPRRRRDHRLQRHPGGSPHGAAAHHRQPAHRGARPANNPARSSSPPASSTAPPPDPRAFARHRSWAVAVALPPRRTARCSEELPAVSWIATRR